MVDIAAASAASSQIQVDAGRSSSQENAAIAKDAEEAKSEGADLILGGDTATVNDCGLH